ncbi:MAG: amidohydrolase family protein [Ilumatobacteraceae bacterium]
MLVDEATGPGPAYLMFFDLHGALANTEAIRQSRLREAKPPASGSVEADLDGPTGFLIEFEAMRLVEDHTPQNSPDQARVLAHETLALMSAHGYTTAHMMNGRLGELDLIRELDERGELPVGLEVCWDLTPELDPADALEAIALLGDRGGHWRMSGVKFWLDGVIDSGSAWCCHADHHGGNSRPLWMPPERYRELAIAYAAAGFRVATHAIGDAAITYALETYQQCDRSARHRIEHLELTNDRNLELLAQHDNVATSVQPPAMAFVSALRDDTWSDRVSTDQWERAWALRDILGTGTHMVMGTDWPVLPLDPRLAFYWAAERRPLHSGPEMVIGRANQALTTREVLAGFTSEAAWAVGRDDAGSIAPGMSADIALWDRDLTTIDPVDTLTTECIVTIAQGRITHDRLGAVG